MEENSLFAIKLFNKSPLKQQKLKMIKELITSYDNRTCLDIGSDNGVIAYYLRTLGGTWYSCDLIPETVESIRSLVKDRVEQITPSGTKYPDQLFDLVVIIDLLEHIHSDREFINDLTRVLKPGGELIINVPNPKEGLWRKFKNLIGQTDAAHGHVRAGYSLNDLRKLLANDYQFETSISYFHFLSDFVDTVLTFALDLLKGKRGQKGTVVTKNDLNKMQKSFKLYALIYPIFSSLVFIDSKLNFLHGNMLITRFRKN